MFFILPGKQKGCDCWRCIHLLSKARDLELSSSEPHYPLDLLSVSTHLNRFTVHKQHLIYCSAKHYYTILFLLSCSSCVLCQTSKAKAESWRDPAYQVCCRWEGCHITEVLTAAANDLH